MGFIVSYRPLTYLSDVMGHTPGGVEILPRRVIGNVGSSVFGA